jgi:Zn-dependent M28 family amino/carboxypeptidase
MALSRVLFCGGFFCAAWCWMPPMQGQTELASQLRADIGMLAGTIGERNVSHRPRQLEQAAAFIEAALAGAGYKVEAQPYNVGGTICRNLAAEIHGTSREAEIVVVGAHYDTVPGSPGADDNASGVAVTLALARHFAHSHPLRTLRFLAFVNEEPPNFQTAEMGSLVYAKRCQSRGERIQAMLSVESVGYYSATQEYPAAVRGLFPPRGDFIAFVGNLGSASLLREAAASFRRAVDLPAEAAALPEEIEGVGWSDHWSFWRQGYPALEITDTAPFRNPFYHHSGDQPETLDYNRLARLTAGMYEVVAALANPALR